MMRVILKLLWFCLLGGLGVGACNDDTVITMQLAYDDSWGITQLEVAARDKRSVVPANHSVRIDVPPAWAGEVVELRVVGLRGETRWAGGVTQVTPRASETVDVSLSLARVPCGQWCTAGETTCVGDAVVVCEADTNGCMEWRAQARCDGDTPSCSLGTCVKQCINECAAGETRCAGPDGMMLCGQADSDACLEWTLPIACPGNDVCADRACRPVCTSECEAGATACLGSSVLTCGDRNFDGCLEWSPTVACASGVCEAGACAAACVDTCQAASCDGAAYHACGQFDLDPCKELSPGTSCAPADRCQEGSCTATGCVQAPKLCLTPPGPECVGDKKKLWDAQGTCHDGTCAYQAREVDCPNCPDCDACAGVTCETPPEPKACYKPAGQCVGEGCQYEFVAGGSCDDGNACTQADTCANNGCAGKPVVCQTPPPARCEGGVRIERQATGSCQGGQCDYPEVRTPCASERCENATTCARCPSSRCVIEGLASSDAFDVKVDATHVYWTDTRGRRVMRVARRGGTPEEVATDDGPWRLALDRDYVYWTNIEYGTVRRLKKGSQQVETVATNQAKPHDITVDGVAVYWANLDGGVRFRSKAMGEILQLTDAPARRITTDAQAVYWTEPGRVMRRPKDGGGPVVLVADAGDAVAIEVDDQHVVWSDVQAGTIRRVGKRHGARPEVVASSQGGVEAFAVDNDNLYWASRDQAAIRMMSKAPRAAVKEIAFGRRDVRTLAVAGMHVYWGGAGSVERLAPCACQ